MDISVPHEDILVYAILMAFRFVRLYVVYTILLRNMYTFLSTVLPNIDKAWWKLLFKIYLYLYLRYSFGFCTSSLFGLFFVLGSGFKQILSLHLFHLGPKPSNFTRLCLGVGCSMLIVWGTWCVYSIYNFKALIFLHFNKFSWIKYFLVYFLLLFSFYR